MAKKARKPKALTQDQVMPFPYPKTEADIPANIKRFPRFGQVYYQCLDVQWAEHFHAWQAAERAEQHSPQPLPFEHVNFNRVEQLETEEGVSRSLARFHNSNNV